MPVPNLKTFCISVIQPYLRAFFDYFNSRLTHAETAAAESNSRAAELEKKLDEAMTAIAEVRASLKKTEEKVE